MIAVTASEFAKNFGRYKEEAQRNPIAITSYGRISGYFMSAHEYQEYQRIKMGMREAYTIKTLPEDLFQEISHSRMDPEFDHLNALLEDK
jgi:PHD/YefM family antitoxin component YafN of YafNO toxin-antitoxin module